MAFLIPRTSPIIFPCRTTTQSPTLSPRRPRRFLSVQAAAPSPSTADEPDPHALDSDDAVEPVRPIASSDTADPQCSSCNGSGQISCSNCNGFGFLRIDEDTEWRTCHICIARGSLICPKCQPDNAVLPINFPPINPPRNPAPKQ